MVRQEGRVDEALQWYEIMNMARPRSIGISSVAQGTDPALRNTTPNGLLQNGKLAQYVDLFWGCYYQRSMQPLASCGKTNIFAGMQVRLRPPLS